MRAGPRPRRGARARTMPRVRVRLLRAPSAGASVATIGPLQTAVASLSIHRHAARGSEGALRARERARTRARVRARARGAYLSTGAARAAHARSSIQNARSARGMVRPSSGLPLRLSTRAAADPGGRGRCRGQRPRHPAAVKSARRPARPTRPSTGQAPARATAAGRAGPGLAPPWPSPEPTHPD